MLLARFAFNAIISRAFVVKHEMQSPIDLKYKGAIEALNSLQSNAQYIKYAKIKNNQENNLSEMAKFLNRSGITLEKLDELSVIHVAGTNGKGTTCAYCESILRNHGYKTGFYSSPHLLDVRERIRINGKPISRDEFTSQFWKVYNLLNKEKEEQYDMPLYFRFLTIMAFHIFIANKVDVAILEVGIGGEYDCTNVVRKTAVAGITPLDIDHTTLLGNSLESIAWNKAGIMKPGSVVFTGEQPENAMEVLKQRSIERKCTLNVIEDFYLDNGHSRIPAHIQRTNASLALALSKAYVTLASNNNGSKLFSMNIAKKSIETCHWPGRYEIIDRKNLRYFLDGAHTLESIRVCSDWFNMTTEKSNRLKGLIFNVTGERNPENLLKQLLKCNFDVVIFLPNVGSDNDSVDTADHILTVTKQLERCKENEKIWLKIDKNSKKPSERTQVLPSVSKAIRFLDDNNQYDVLVTGSIHLIGAAMTVLDPDLKGALK